MRDRAAGIAHLAREIALRPSSLRDEAHESTQAAFRRSGRLRLPQLPLKAACRAQGLPDFERVFDLLGVAIDVRELRDRAF